MPSIRIISLPVVALCAALVGCNENQKTAQDDILRQNDDLTKELASKNDSLNSMGEQLSRLQQITRTSRRSWPSATASRRSAPPPSPPPSPMRVTSTASRASRPPSRATTST